MEWTVVTVLVTIVGLGFTVGVPIINLNKNITMLNANIQRNNEELAEQKEALKEQKKDAHESHQKLWDKNDEQDKVLSDHETRIRILEKTE